MEYVCIYNRCSTEEEEQVNALNIQVAESREIVERNPDWELVEQFVEVQSGTMTGNRMQYCRMLEGIEMHRFTLVVIKSIDRLMRNAKDWYLFLDCIARNGVRLYMYLECKYYDAEDSLLTGIKAILAEDFSRELSKKIKNAHRRRQEKRSGYNITREMFGWNRIAKDCYELNEKEAAWYRQAFLLAEKGYGYRRISDILYEQGARSRSGGGISPVQWRNMLLSPRAHGTVIIRKSEYDFTRKQRIPVPEAEQIVIENALPPIVSEAHQERVIRILQTRSFDADKRKERKGRHRYPLSGKITCGICGSVFYPVKAGRNRQEQVWKCSSYLSHGKKSENGGCSNISIKEKVLYDMLTSPEQSGIKTVETLILTALQKNFGEDGSGNKQKEYTRLLAKNSTARERLMCKLLEGVVSDEEYRIYARKLREEAEDLRQKTGMPPVENAEVLKMRHFTRLQEKIKEREIAKQVLAVLALKKTERIEVFPEGEVRLFYLDGDVTRKYLFVKNG